MILVTGATGALGTSVIEFLLKKTSPDQIAALVRNPDKAANLQAKGIEIRIGDYDDPKSLVAAFQGVNKLYFVSGSDVQNRSAQHKNVVDAATIAGVGHIVYSSFDRKTEDGSSPIAFVADSHLKTEAWIKESGLPYTLMLHGLYTDMLPVFLGDKLLETGVLYQSTGDGKTAFTLRSDMAEAAAEVLTSEGHTGKSYRIVADKALSYADIAAQLTELKGKQFHHVSPTKAEYMEALTQAGVPDGYVGFFAAFNEAIKAGEFENTQSDIEQLIGRKPTAVRAFLSQVYA